MNDLKLAIVVGCHFTDSNFDLSTGDAWHFALHQRAFGPRRVIVMTARQDGQALGLAYCGRTQPPEVALKCCLASLDDRADAAVVYSDEPVGAELPSGLAERFVTAREAASEYGVFLVDWMMCDDTQFLSMRCTLEDVEQWWDVPSTPGPDP